MKPNATPSQLAGNVGLYWVCYRLSCHGWNVMPTSRNARGVDIMIYSQTSKIKKTIQVKALTKRNPVALGKELKESLADFLVICVGITEKDPLCYVLLPGEIARGVRKFNGKTGPSHWLQPAHYTLSEFCERWDRIGDGRDDR